MFAFEYEDHTNCLTESIQGLFKRNVLVDCTLSAEHKFIHGHQVVLSACSPYFEFLFSQKQDRKPVVLKDVKFQDLKSLVDFMYFGEVYIPTEQINSFMETAKALQVKGLTNLYMQENNVQWSDDSEVNVKNKCEMKKWNFCEKSFEIKTESESQSSTSGTSEIEKCAELNYNADCCNEDSVRELKLTFNRFTVIEKSEDDSQNPDNNSTGGQHMTQHVVESDSFSGELKMEYEDNCSAVSLLPFLKKENESYIMQDDSNHSNVSNRNIVDHCPVDTETVVKGEIEIEENKLNFHENYEVTNLPEITSNDALPSTSHDSLNHATAVCVISGADSYKEFKGNFENPSSGSVSTSRNSEDLEETRGSCGDNVILGLENFDLNVWSSKCVGKYGQGEESKSNDSGPKLYLPDNTISLRYVETEETKLCEKSEDQTGLLKDTAIGAGDGTGLKKNQSLALPKGSPIFTPLKPQPSTISRNYECTTCLKRFARSGDLKKHLVTHSGEKNYVCTVCPKRFARSGDLKQHLLTHSGEKNYKCSNCPKRFNRSADLKKHLLTHSGEKNYECTICTKRFTRSGNLKTHLLTHSGEKNYECTLCCKRFTQSGGLNQHLLMHNGEKNYVCTICGKRFAQSGNLNQHILTHSGDTKYECTVCCKRFTHSAYLKKHLLKHTGERKYSCTVCAKTFTENGSLKTHLLTHTGERKYNCTICAKRFTQSGDLKRHLLTHTGERK